jgi:hypothetical protein
MVKKELKAPDYLIIAANLVPVIGVFFFGWSAIDVFIAYALETLIVGAFTVIKLGIATLYRGKDEWYNYGTSTKQSGLFFIFFFIIHYGLFAAIQTSIFSAVSKIEPPNAPFFHFFFHWYQYVNRETGIMLCGLIVSYAARDLIPFLSKGHHKTVPMMLLMFQPYGRIFIQQFVVILGSMFLVFGFEGGFILVFALIKIYFDVYMNFSKVLDKAMTDMKKESGEKKT